MSKDRIINFFDWVIEVCFYALVVAVTFSTSLVEIFSSIMIGAWLIKKAIDRDWKGLNSAPFKILLIFFLWTVLSTVNSDYFKESFRGIFKVVEYSLIFVVAATSLGEEKVARRFLYVLSASAFLICINGLIQYYTGFDLIRHRGLITKDSLHRISASFVHPNDFGTYLFVVGTIFISFLISRGARLRERVMVFIPLVLSMVSLFLTKSRGAWISFAAAFLVLGAIKARKVLAVFIAVLLVLFLVLPYTAQERIFALADFKSGTAWERVMLWKGTINMIIEHPILGFGVNTYSRNFPRYKPPEYPDVRYTHNSYLHMASEVGLVGALLFLIFLVTVLMHSFRNILTMDEGRRRGLTAGLFAGMVGFSMNCMVDTHLYSVTLAVFFHLLLGFCYALSCHARER